MLRIGIHILRPENEKQLVQILPGQTVSFGRRRPADIECDDSCMTSIHFEVEHKGNVAEIRDVQSIGGTFLNGQRIRSAELCNGDLVRAGRTRFEIELQESSNEAMKSEQL
jgi:pSer/pThr/pTyr-binding forkhead associated (FHA) protein